MALASMTGHGRGAAAVGGVRAEVEVSAVNGRQLDVRVNLPRGLQSLEARIRDAVEGAVSRGSLLATVAVRLASGATPPGSLVDRGLARALLADLRKTAAALGLRDDLSARALLQMPDALRTARGTEDPRRTWPAVSQALSEALRRLVAMRRKEGAALARDLAKRCGRLRAETARIRELAPAAGRRHAEAVHERLRTLEPGLFAGAGGEGMPGRPRSWAQEVLLFAERSDVTEEIVRLESHLSHFAGLAQSGKPMGRTLDFVCQEMLREINTIGSKALDVGISRAVVEFKTELERIREQVQNVE